MPSSAWNKKAADEHPATQRFALAHFHLKVSAEAVLVVPGVAFAVGLVGQLYVQARAQHGLGAQQVLERAHRELRRIEVLRLRPEAHFFFKVPAPPSALPFPPPGPFSV